MSKIIAAILAGLFTLTALSPAVAADEKKEEKKAEKKAEKK